MTINNQPKAVTAAVNIPLDPAPSQEAPRATGDGAGSAPPLRSPDIDMEVVPRAKLRRKGVYSSSSLSDLNCIQAS